MIMSEKLAYSSSPTTTTPHHLHHHILAPTRRVSLLAAFSMGAILLLLWTNTDHSTLTNLVADGSSRTFFYYNQFTTVTAAVTAYAAASNSTWLTVDLRPNFSSYIMSQWLSPAGPEKTVDIRIPYLDDNQTKPISISAGYPHEFSFQAVDAAGNPVTSSGDYFEIDLSGEWWKSRPPITDLGGGNYSFTVQVHKDFPGEYNLTITLLFRHFEGTKFSPTRFAFDRQLRRIPITVPSSSGDAAAADLPRLEACRGSDFNRTLWAGRWTRHVRNDRCEVDDDGRFRCQPPDFPCPANDGGVGGGGWCSGPLGSLESNGWVYSAHCQFKLFTSSEAWDCLDGRWLLWWGDSNHVDTVRNLLFFLLDVPELESVTRRFDKTFTNPKNGTQSVRITNIFNGHWDDKGNYEGLNSLSDPGYRDLISSYFNASTVPDTVIFNSGLHDGVKWVNLRRFVAASEFAAQFWADAVRPARERGKTRLVFRSTVATGGYARTLAFNPNKIEAYNGILLDKMMARGAVDAVVDDFDMTWAWHFDNRCNDGVHYGRFPAKMKWKDGGIGHQYFVDLMLGHVLLNAICLK